MAITIRGQNRKDRYSGTWPDATNTGWARTGVTLTAYTGPTTLALGQTIDSKTITDDLVITSHVTITRCNIGIAHLDCDGAARSLTLEDCNIDAGTWQSQAVGFSDLTIRRCNIIGGTNSVISGSNILIEDSWLHAQYLAPTAEWHENAFICNGGSNIVLRHNTLHADQENNGFGGGVSTNCSLFGDFAPIEDVLIEGNLLKATPGGYGCSAGYNPGKPFGDNPTNVTWRDNVFERGPSGQCGVEGPVTSFLDANGNVWSNNRYEDGELIPAA